MGSAEPLVGAWLAALARQCGLGQAEIAQRLAHERSWINHIFQGRRGAPPKLYWALLAWAWEAQGFTEPGELLAAVGQYVGLSPAAALAQLRQTPLPEEARGCQAQVDALALASEPAPARGTPACLRARLWQWLHTGLAQYLAPGGQGVRLPDWYVPRLAELAAVRAQLVAGPPAATVVLWGPGGSGKSLLAQALLLDPAVQQHYWNGVLWARLGPQGAPGAWLSAWCRLLQLPVTSTAPAALREQLRNALTAPGKRYLIVVDDVWDYAALEPLLIPGANLGWLLTTRDRTLCTYFPAGQLHPVPALTPPEARTLLERLVGPVQLQQEPPAAAPALLARVEYLPLAVRLLGCLIRLRGWAPVWRDVGSERTRIAMLALGPTPTPETSVRLALQMSYAALPPLLQEQFAQLGVFGYGHTFAGPGVAAFWGLAQPGATPVELAALAEQALGWLYDVGLLELVATEPPFIVYRLHTLVHDYARLLLWEQGAWVAAQQQYVTAHTLLGATDVPAVLEEQWPNLQLAFTYACDLGWYAAAATLLGQACAFLLARWEGPLLETWLARLAEHWEQLAAAEQGVWHYAQAHRLYAQGQPQAARSHHQQYLAQAGAAPQFQAVLAAVAAACAGAAAEDTP